jgi:hypothetical protein
MDDMGVKVTVTRTYEVECWHEDCGRVIAVETRRADADREAKDHRAAHSAGLVPKHEPTRV